MVSKSKLVVTKPLDPAIDMSASNYYGENWNGGTAYRDVIDVLYDLTQHYGKLEAGGVGRLWDEARAVIERQRTWGWTPKDSHLVPLSQLGRAPE